MKVKDSPDAILLHLLSKLRNSVSFAGIRPGNYARVALRHSGAMRFARQAVAFSCFNNSKALFS